MNADSLLAFVTTVNERSFSKAALKLHLTQPAVTKRIQNLENQTQVKLFERLQKEIVLTEAGQVLLPHALSVLHEIDNAKHALLNFENKVSGQLRIIASHHIGLHRLPLILKKFNHLYPDVELALNFLDSESAYSLLKDNQADIAFITIPAEIKKDFECHLKWDDPMSFVCGKSHRLCSLTTILPADLSEHNAILPSQSTLTYRVVESIFKENQLKLQASIPTNYLETMKMMASVGMGWTVLPDTMIDDDLYIMPIKHKQVTRTLGAVSYRRKSLSNAALAFMETSESIWGRI